MAEAIACPVASNLLSKLGECLLAPIGRQFGYVLCYKSYINDLKNGVKELETAWERVQHDVQDAKNNGKPIYTDVENWLKSVKEEIEKADNLLKCGESANNACFRGWLPNPVVRHLIGRKVMKITKVIQRLQEKSRNNNFQKVYHESPPIGIVTATTSVARSFDNKEDVLESRAKIMEDVMKAVVDDKVNVIGVWGVGGVGKSRLLEDVERRIKEQKLYDVVAKANISRNPDLKRIQGEIAYALGLKLMNEETTYGRANRLRERLEGDNKKNILIILDNLWEKLELKEVGIPCGDGNKVRSCKLLLTSRYRDVLRIHMCSDQQFQLNKLEDGEARRLFKRIVEDRVMDPKFTSLVKRVVKNCGGLPLLIVSLAKTLRHGDLAAWRNASTYIDESNVKSLVEQNYNDLKDERIQSLFLICALDSGKIFVRDSFIYCMGLGLYEKFSNTIEDARDRLIVDLHRLQDSSLLLDSNDLEKFRMHDIFVDAAISMFSTEWNALVGRKGFGFKKWSTHELRKCTAISFLWVGIDELPENLDCPNLRMLLLVERNPSLKIPDSFFESMEKLQVLDLTGLYFTSLPSSIKFLGNLKSLCLDQCHLEDVTILGKLKGLQFLSFLASTIPRLPKEIGELTELRFLDLTECIELKVIEPGVLGSLVNLEELNMEDSFDQWEAEDEAPPSNASLAELKSMKNLSTLCIAIPQSVNLSTGLPFGKLNKYKIQIGDVWNWSGKYKESRTLKLKLDSRNLPLEEWVSKCSQKPQDLHLDGLQNDIHNIHDLCVGGFQELKHLHVQNSSSFQYVVDSTENVQCTAFTRLESLFLKNLNNLEKICRGSLSLESFNKLKILKVDNCNEIKHLFPFSMKRIISQLEEIEISKCCLMQQILADGETNEDGDEIDDDTKVTSCKLRRLTLRNLPKMTSFCKTADHLFDFFDGQQVSLASLESLTISELPKLKEIWNSQFPSIVSNLKFFKVEDCAFLLSIFPSNLVTKLQNLEAITIERCQLLREVFDLEGLTVIGDVEILSQLTTLTLSDLSRLGHIWNKNPRRALCFRNLRVLKVQNCENLRFIFSSSMAKALQQIKEIKIVRCKLLEEIIHVQEEESKEDASIDTLEFPLLSSLSLEELPNLRTFSYGTYCIHYPTLTRLTISECPKMMTFFSFEGKQRSITADAGLQKPFGRVNSDLSLPVFFNEKVLFPSLEKLKLSSMCELKRIWHNQFNEQSFYKLTSLTLELCENLSHVFPSNSINRLQSLYEIKVIGCPSLEALFEPVSLKTERRQKPLVLSALKKVELLNLPRLRDILKSECKVTLAFPSLKEVNARHCHSLSYLFSSVTAKTLHELVVLDVSCCNNLRGIIVMEEGKGETVETFKFPHLTKLKLDDLKSLVCFSSENCASDGSHPLFDEKLAFPKLEELHVEGVQQKEIWNDKIHVESFCHLKVLKVKQCHNLMNVIPSSMWKRLLHCMESLTVEKCQCLRNLFTMSMAKSLGQLQYLGLGGCGEIEYIVAKEEEEPKEATDQIVIPQLVTLYLHNMPKLRSFCQGKHILEWPSLKEFTIDGCKAVKVILGDVSCGKLEGSVPTHQPLLLVEKVEFPSMESMKILHMDNMEKIWLDDLDLNAFVKLKMLVVAYCEKLLSIFSSYNVLTRFRNLEKITVTDCGSLEVVFQVQEFEFIEACSTNTFQLRELVLMRLSKMKRLWSELPQGGLTFGRLQCTEVVQCESLKSLFPSSVAKSMTQLQKLLLLDCGVEEIIAEEDEVGMNAGDLFFPQLTELRLVDLLKLRSFHQNSHTSTWPLFKQLQVRHCNKMRSFSFACEFQSCQGTTTSENQPTLFSFEKVISHLKVLELTRDDVVMLPQHYIFDNLKELGLGCYHDENIAFPSDFLLQGFPNLEGLRVQCSSFEEIFSEDDLGHGGATPCGGLTDVEKPLKSLGNLKQLWLLELCNLRGIWKDGSLMAEILKQVEFLYLSQCLSLSIVFPSPASFQRLMILEVRECASLVHLGTCSAMTSLVHLTQLTLSDCGVMEDMATDDGDGAKEILFPKLKQLILDRLPSLGSFSPTNCAFRFPSLECIVITQCPKMNIFCNGALRTPKLDKVLLSKDDGEGHWEGDLNTTIRTLSTCNNP
ncbi:uncharacterized protein LOC104435251 [Eucalyptus grandis]|uniref:uncharacterized protein LOC104435251 n=1 Tax=Eucalyptus grandis TaxID=71139 RepID=UPI00192E9ED1|nr:uncharacterized protein LOC104435251 [Eucalyptus grandis]